VTARRARWTSARRLPEIVHAAPIVARSILTDCSASLARGARHAGLAHLRRLGSILSAKPSWATLVAVRRWEAVESELAGSSLFATIHAPVAALPRKTSFQFDLQAETQERPDEDYACEHRHAVQGRSNSNRSNDVPGHQHLESQQDRASDVLTIALVTIGRATECPQVSRGRDCQTEDDQKNASNIYERATVSIVSE
jgi:hypothetical protein